MNGKLIQWLQKHNLTNPHEIPDTLKPEYETLFSDTLVFAPQLGGQTDFLNCGADICLFGGEAGSGKSFVLLFDPAKWIERAGYVATIVRKTYSQIFDAGGLWDEAIKIYPKLGGRSNRGDKPKFVFDSGAQIYFKHSQHATHVEQYWQGLQSAVICIDELTHFSKAEFLYIMSRNRSTCGVNSYMRMTCNPDPNSWVKQLIEWWIDDEGYIIKERSGVVRYFIHRDDKFIFGDTKGELYKKFGGKIKPKSFTFVRGYLKENKKLLEQDEGYEASLDNLTESQRHALRSGNWNEVHNPDALFSKMIFNKYRVETIDFEKLERIVVGIDPAGSTNEDSDETGIIIGGIDDAGHCYLWEDRTGKYKPIEWAKKACDLYDMYNADLIVAERNYGGDMVESTINNFRPDIYPKLVHASRGKAVRAEPVAMLYEKGMIHHVGHSALEKTETEMASFTTETKKSPNRMDALVWVITELALKQQAIPSIRQL